MNNLQIFNSNEFGSVRTLKKDNKPYFALVDICRILEINNSRQAKTRLNEDGVISNDVIDNLGRIQKVVYINESNLYKLIFQSRKPQAEKFSEWVTGEVLPTLRETGIYTMPHMSKELQAILMIDNKTEELREDFNNFRDNAPLFNIECERLTKAVRNYVEAFKFALLILIEYVAQYLKWANN